MNIESMVRDALHSHANGAPPSAGLVGAARARASRRRARRAMVGAMAGAVVGLLALAIPYGIPMTGSGSDVPGSGPPPVTFPPVALAEPSYEVPTFPFTPGWQPDEVKPPFLSYSAFPGHLDGTAELSGRIIDFEHPYPEVSLMHLPVSTPVDEHLSVGTYSTDPTGGFEQLEGQPITVQGRSATLYQTDWENFVIWRHEPDLWVMVWAGLGIDVADIERYAEELDETPFVVEPPFTFDLLPAGAELTGLDQLGMQFHTPDGVGVSVYRSEPPPSSEGTSPDPTDAPSTDNPSTNPTDGPSSGPTDGPSSEPSETAAAETSDPGLASPAPPQPRRIEVGGVPAELLEWTEGPEVQIRLGQGGILSVHGFSMNSDDLLAVVEGMRITS